MHYSSDSGSGLVAVVMATPAALVMVSLVTVLVALRMWREVTAKENEPPSMPYWIPWLGNAVSMSRDIDGLIDSAKKHFGSKIFTVTAAGKRIHITNSLPDLAEVFRKPKTLVFWPLIEQGMRNIYAFSSATIFKITKQVHGTPESALCANAHTFYNRHLMSGESLDLLLERYTNELSSFLNKPLSTLTSKDTVVDAKSEILEVSLLSWSRNIIGITSLNTVMGPRLLRESPEFMGKFWEFDADIMKLMYKYPKFLTKKAVAGRDFCHKALKKYFDEETNPQEEQADLIWRRMDMLREAGMDNEEAALCTLTVIWGLQTNSSKCAFWTLLYVLTYPNLADRIRTETAALYPASSSSASFSPTQLATLCPLLNSTFHETLRLVSTWITARCVSASASLGGYNLREGDLLLAPVWQTQHSKEIWGEDADTFDPERYIRDPDKFRSPMFRPFGGGVSLCPGRMLARIEICLFVAEVLKRWDVEVMGDGVGMEKIPPGKNLFQGVLDLDGGRDVRVRLTPRKI